MDLKTPDFEFRATIILLLLLGGIFRNSEFLKKISRATFPTKSFSILTIKTSCFVRTFIFKLAKFLGLWLWLSGFFQQQRFESSHRQTFILKLFTVNCIKKTKIKKKRPVMAHYKKHNFDNSVCQSLCCLIDLFVFV